MPDFLTCGQCVCNGHAAGCDTLYAIQDRTLYCGQACGATSSGMPCGSYCATVEAGTPDAELINAACDACAAALMNGDPDADAFVADCQADAECATALATLAMCPLPAE